MRADLKSLRGLKLPDISVPQMDPQKREWYVAGFFSLLWVAGLGTYGMGYFSGTAASVLEVAIFVATLLIPVMCLWVGAFVLNWSRRVDAQTAELIGAVTELQGALAIATPATADTVVNSVTEAAKSAVKAEQNRMNSALRVISEDQRQMGDAVRKLVQVRQTEQAAMEQLVTTAQSVTSEAAEAAQAADVTRASSLAKSAIAAAEASTQDALPFDDATKADVDADALRWTDVNRALNFPSDEQDKATFAAIRAVMPNRTAADLLKRAEAVMALLAEEGIYMDDLEVSPPNPEDWRAFAEGTRGPGVASLGGVTDPAATALAKGRIRTDAAFQETTLDFLRAFDRFLQDFAGQAKTQDLIGLGNTRTGRAFQLLARVTGAFS